MTEKWKMFTSFYIAWLIFTLCCSAAPLVVAPGISGNSNDITSNPISVSPTAFEDDDTSVQAPFYTPQESAQAILSRVGSAATCLAAGVEYTHGQQIYRADPCEFCLCLDGSVFCWWQDCRPVTPEYNTNPPCKDRFPFAAGPCTSSPASDSNNNPTTVVYATRSTAIAVGSNSESSSSSSSNQKHTSSNGNNVTSSSTSVELGTTASATTNQSGEQHTPAQFPTVCIVMGVEYKIGDILPHDTGNCVECICGQGAKISCSPHGCVTPEGDGDSVDRHMDPEIF